MAAAEVDVLQLADRPWAEISAIRLTGTPAPLPPPPLPEDDSVLCDFRSLLFVSDGPAPPEELATRLSSWLSEGGDAARAALDTAAPALSAALRAADAEAVTSALGGVGGVTSALGGSTSAPDGGAADADADRPESVEGDGDGAAAGSGRGRGRLCIARRPCAAGHPSPWT